MAKEPPPTEVAWQHATDCLYWLADRTGDPEVTRVMYLLDDEMRSLDDMTDHDEALKGHRNG